MEKIVIIIFFISLIIFLNFESIYFSVLYSIIISGISFLIIRRIPKIMNKIRASKIESDLSIALRAISIQLKMRIPFEEAIKSVSTGYNCSEEFKIVLENIERGMSVQDSLRKMGERVDSRMVKKVAMQLISSYEEGSKGEEIKKIADELTTLQKAKLREFSASVSFLSLFYIGISCIVPILFLTYAVVTSIFLGEKISSETIRYIFLLVFPIVIILMIIFIKMKTPNLMLSEERIISKREIEIIERKLKRIKMNLKSFIFLSSFVTLLLFLFLFSNQFPLNYLILILFIPFFLIFIILYTIDARNKEIENYLPDAIFQLASFEKGAPIERMIRNVAKSNFGALSEEFNIAYNQIKAGADIPKALADISKRNSSKILDRVINLFICAYKIGKEVQVAIRETAEDVFEMESLMKEQTAALSIQKYTIFASFFLLPIILAIVINLISGLHYSTSKISEIERIEIIATIKEVSSMYILIYVFLSSIFISIQEGKKRNFIIYLLIFSFLSSIIFDATISFVKL